MFVNIKYKSELKHKAPKFIGALSIPIMFELGKIAIDFLAGIFYRNIFQFIKTKWFNKDSVVIRIDPQDLWNLDYTLAQILSPALKAFRDDPATYFMVDDDDIPNYTELNSLERCHALLDKIINGFDEILSANNKYDIEEVDKALYLFAKYYRKLWN